MQIWKPASALGLTLTALLEEKHHDKERKLRTRLSHS